MIIEIAQTVVEIRERGIHNHVVRNLDDHLRARQITSDRGSAG